MGWVKAQLAPKVATDCGKGREKKGDDEHKRNDDRAWYSFVTQPVLLNTFQMDHLWAPLASLNIRLVIVSDTW